MVRPSYTPQDRKNMTVVANNLKNLMSVRGLTQTALSDVLDIPVSTLSGYLNETSLPNAGNVQKLADFFHIQKSQLDPRFDMEFTPKIKPVIDGPYPIKEGEHKTKIVKVPIIGTIACGDPITAEENIEGYLDEPEDSLPNGNLFYLIAKGHSMEPTIPDGSKVLIREQPMVEDDEIAAVLVNGDTEATLKRIKHQGSLVMLMPDNKDFDPIIITKDNPARILGKAIQFVTTL